jgi:site-specific DNA-cytosine methylase
VFFCALRDDIDRPLLKLEPRHRWISAREATADVQVLTNAEQVETDISKYSIYAKAKPLKQGEAHNKNFNLLRIDGEKPSNSIPAKIADTSAANPIHWKETRALSFREVIRLGSFPDDYHAKTDKIGKYMIGMSVPPRMTETVARAVIEQWLT